MKSLFITLFLTFSLLSFSQFYERIGQSRQQIITEFSKYETVEKIIDNNSLYISTNKTEIFYLFDWWTDKCVRVFVVPFQNKTRLEFLNAYKKKYRTDENDYFIYTRNDITINIYPLFNCQNELFFTFKEKTIQ